MIYPLAAQKQINALGAAGGKRLTFEQKVTALNPFLWWKLNETSGTVIEDYQVGGTDHDGTLTLGDGTLGAEGIGDGNTSIAFDGSSTQISVSGNPSLAMPSPAGTIAVWTKLAAGTWTDSTVRLIRFDKADSNNYVRIGRSNTNNFLKFEIDMGGAADRTISLNSGGTTDWILHAGTWDASGIASYILALGGTTIASGTAAATGTWSTGAALWQMGYSGAYLKGNFAHMMILPTKLTEAQLQDLASV